MLGCSENIIIQNQFQWQAISPILYFALVFLHFRTFSELVDWNTNQNSIVYRRAILVGFSENIIKISRPASTTSYLCTLLAGGFSITLLSYFFWVGGLKYFIEEQ